MTLPKQYTETRIAAALARKTFAGALVVVDNTYAIGSECDLLVITKNLMAIDVEIKISVADLKRDRAKDKWIDRHGWPVSQETPRQWPRGCHKHYYALPASIWREDLLEHCQPKSGVIVVTLGDDGGLRGLRCVRRVTANPDAKPVTNAKLVDIARLASLRMWDARTAREAIAAELNSRLNNGAAA
jgi:hypothetical protein